MTYPPQQGSGPYGQPGPYGQQPPQPGYGYPQQQQPGHGHPQQQAPHGAPQQQMQPPPPQQWSAAPPPPPPPSRRGGIGIMKILKGIVIVIGVIVIAVGYFMSRDDADQAEAGDCMKNNGTMVSPDLQVVECGGTDAEFKVVEVIPDTVDTKLCKGKSDIGYQEQTSGRRSSGKQFVLCIDEIKK
ncbi:hypothetical protein BKD26_21495 [Streptomyces sp. CB03238]|nr:hypothetical protein BKD26_21495 [Streptomyces sp. CB03238]